MSMSCDVIMDLAGLYYDGSASAASVSAIEGHIKECPDCRRFYRHYKLLMEQRHREEASAGKKAGDFGALASRLRRRRMIVAFCLAAYSCAVAGVLLYELLRKKSKS